MFVRISSLPSWNHRRRWARRWGHPGSSSPWEGLPMTTMSRSHLHRSTLHFSLHTVLVDATRMTTTSMWCPMMLERMHPLSSMPRIQTMPLSIIALLASFLYQWTANKNQVWWRMEHLDSFSSAPTLLGPSFLDSRFDSSVDNWWCLVQFGAAWLCFWCLLLLLCWRYLRQSLSRQKCSRQIRNQQSSLQLSSRQKSQESYRILNAKPSLKF